jgi:protein gp37
MATATSIEWTETTWNPVRGCSRLSAGCQHCYAERMAHRFSGPGMPYEGLTRRSSVGPQWTGRIRLVREALDEPLRWRSPRLVFVNSMSDLFHEDVPLEFIESVFATMRLASHHRFQVLTKRADRLADLAPRLDWPPNVWMGVSVESDKFTWRIDRLRSTDAAVKFLSLEPLLSALPGLNLDGIDWAIVGGESGPSARPMKAAWVRDLKRQCAKSKVPFFFKQWGGVVKSRAGRLLDGREYNEMPGVGSVRRGLQVRRQEAR